MSDFNEFARICNKKIVHKGIKMISKNEPHLLFRVLNFLKTQKHLLQAERNLLTMLATHAGPRGIYPSITTLANESGISIRYTKRILLRLSEYKLIKITTRSGKNSFYEFLFLYTDPASTDHQCTTDHRCTVDAKSSDPQYQNPASTDHPIRLNNQIKEREREKPALSVVNFSSNKKGGGLNDIDTNVSDNKSNQKFSPDDANQALCMELKLNLTDELESFNHRHNGKYTQYEFKRWLKNSCEYQNKKNPARLASQNQSAPSQPKIPQETDEEQKKRNWKTWEDRMNSYKSANGKEAICKENRPKLIGELMGRFTETKKQQ